VNAEELMPAEEQIELVAAIIEAIGKNDEKKETVTGLVLALALFVYTAPLDGEVVDLARVMDVAGLVSGKAKVVAGDAACKAAVEVLTKGLK
jgi:desumoylating isopeptidase 1